MPGSSRKQGKGRIHPHQRDTDDKVDVIGGAIALPADLEKQYQETAKHEMNDNCRKNYRQRISRIIKFWKTNDREYYDVGVKSVSAEDLAIPSNYYYNRYKEDIVYSGLNVNFLKHFHVKNKWKSDGKLKSWDDQGKYKDALMWGAKIKGERLPTSFYEMNDT